MSVWKLRNYILYQRFVLLNIEVFVYVSVFQLAHTEFLLAWLSTEVVRVCTTCTFSCQTFMLCGILKYTIFYYLSFYVEECRYMLGLGSESVKSIMYTFVW